MENKKLGRLTKRSEFDYLYNFGNSTKNSRWIQIKWSKNELNIIRIGMTVSGKVGGSVLRNKLKRWLREYFRLVVKTESWQKSVDINVLLRPKEPNFYKNIKREEFWKELEKCSSAWK